MLAGHVLLRLGMSKAQGRNAGGARPIKVRWKDKAESPRLGVHALNEVE